MKKKIYIIHTRSTEKNTQTVRDKICRYYSMNKQYIKGIQGQKMLITMERRMAIE